MLSFKQYLQEALAITPQARNRILANINRNKQALGASNYTEGKPLKPLNRQQVPADAAPGFVSSKQPYGRGFKGSRFQPDQPVASRPERFSSKLNQYISGRQTDMAAKAAITRAVDTKIGVNMFNRFLGQRVMIKNREGQTVGSDVKGGFVGALRSYDAYRARQGIAVNKRNTIDPTVVRNLGIVARDRMSSNPSGSGPNLLRTLGATARYGSELKSGAADLAQRTGTAVQRAGESIGGLNSPDAQHLVTTKLDGTPINPEDRAAAITQAAQYNKLSQTGQAAQTVGMETTPVRSSGETQDEMRARMAANRPAPLPTSTQSRINTMKKTGTLGNLS